MDSRAGTIVPTDRLDHESESESARLPCEIGATPVPESSPSHPPAAGGWKRFRWHGVLKCFRRQTFRRPSATSGATGEKPCEPSSARHARCISSLLTHRSDSPIDATVVQVCPKVTIEEKAMSKLTTIAAVIVAVTLIGFESVDAYGQSVQQRRQRPGTTSRHRAPQTYRSFSYTPAAPRVAATPPAETATPKTAPEAAPGATAEAAPEATTPKKTVRSYSHEPAPACTPAPRRASSGQAYRSYSYAPRSSGQSAYRSFSYAPSRAGSMRQSYQSRSSGNRGVNSIARRRLQPGSR